MGKKSANGAAAKKVETVTFVPKADYTRVEIAVQHIDKALVVEKDGLEVETSDAATLAELDAHPHVKRATKGG